MVVPANDAAPQALREPPRPGPSYFSNDTLLKENKAAYEGLRQALFATVTAVMRNDFPR